MIYEHISKRAQIGLAVPVTGLLLAVSAAAVAQETATVPDKKRIAYVDHGCYQCHGYEGQGGGFGGPRIAPDPLPYAAFAEVVRRPYGVMPAYSTSVLNSVELKLIYDYLVSISEPPSAEEIRSLLNDQALSDEK